MTKEIPIKINGKMTTITVDIGELTNKLLSRSCSADEIQKILILIVNKFV